MGFLSPSLAPTTVACSIIPNMQVDIASVPDGYQVPTVLNSSTFVVFRRKPGAPAASSFTCTASPDVSVQLPADATATIINGTAVAFEYVLLKSRWAACDILLENLWGEVGALFYS